MEISIGDLLSYQMCTLVQESPRERLVSRRTEEGKGYLEAGADGRGGMYSPGSGAGR
jgi:hypothetical protein